MSLEQDLVGRIVAGDLEAGDRLFRVLRPRLLRTSMGLIGIEDSEAEDIVRESFLIALAKIKAQGLMPPLYQPLRHICLSLCYARLRDRRAVAMAVEENLQDCMRILAGGDAGSSGADLPLAKKMDLLRLVAGRMETASSQVIEFRSVRGLSYAEISQRLGIDVGLVLGRLARARDQMKEAVKGA